LIELHESGKITAETAIEYAESKNNVSLHIRLNKGDGFDGVDLQLDEIDRR
jgi:twitching motility protein PilU